MVDNDFEKNFGMWRQDKMEKLDWILAKGPTRNFESGPTGDHTTGYGNYYKQL